MGCWFGRYEASTECSASLNGEEATFTHDRLAPRNGMTIAAAYDGGSFPGAAPLLKRRLTWANTMGGAGTAAAAGAGSLVAALGTPLLVAARRRDERFLDLPPGTIPPRGAQPPVGTVPRGFEVPVRFTPPAGLNPADVGMIMAGRFEPRFVTATIVDLAVRGYVHITSVGTEPRRSNWELTRVTSQEEGLSDYERRLLEALFDRSLTVNLDDLDAAGQRRVARVVARQETRPKGEGWFDRDPAVLKTTYIAAGAGLIALGALLTWLLGIAGLGLLGAPVAAGTALMFWPGRARKRTALGTPTTCKPRGSRRTSRPPRPVSGDSKPTGRSSLATCPTRSCTGWSTRDRKSVV